MKGEKGTRAWVRSGEKSRFIDLYMKEDKTLINKAKAKKRKKLDVTKAVEDLLKIVNKQST